MKDKAEPTFGDDLDLALEREVILLAGGPQTTKSYSTAMLCVDGLEQGYNVVVIDKDRGLAKAIKEVYGEKPPNLTYFLANTWQRINDGVDYAMEHLVPGDWLVFEMAGGFWDFAQTEYSRRVYGEDLSQHILALRGEAQEQIRAAGLDTKSKEARKIVGEKIGYQGLEGRTDWSLVKRMHNDDVFDNVIINGNFNVLSTTSITPLSDDDLSKNKWPLFSKIGKRPEGEKHNIHRHDTIAICYFRDGKYLWRTDLGGGLGKDRGGRELVQDINCTDIGFIASYLSHHKGEPNA